MLSVNEIEDIVSRIEYKGWELNVTHTVDHQNIYFQVSFWDGKEKWNGRKWLLSKYMTLSEIVQTVFKAIMTAEEHEIREKFLFDGEAVFGPHFDVEFMAATIKYKRDRGESNLDVRENVKV